VVYSPLGGKLEKEMNTIKELTVEINPDVILAQHIPCAVDIKKTFPHKPFVYYCHGVVQEIEQPPPFPIQKYIVINEECKKNYMEKGIKENQITIIRDFIDTERFKATKPINKTVQHVLFISNYKKWRNYQAVYGACKKLNVNLVCCGSPYGRNYKIEEEINNADLVVSWARGILEAMSCSRAAVSFDRYEGDGYIDQTTYFEARQDNFSGRHFKHAFNEHTLAEEIMKFNQNDGRKNREYIEKYHDVKNGVNEILNILNTI
jgi:hypothetical protein